MFGDSFIMFECRGIKVDSAKEKIIKSHQGEETGKESNGKGGGGGGGGGGREGGDGKSHRPTVVVTQLTPQLKGITKDSSKNGKESPKNRLATPSRILILLLKVIPTDSIVLQRISRFSRILRDSLGFSEMFSTTETKQPEIISKNLRESPRISENQRLCT